MKRKGIILLCAILAGVFVSGCGGEYTGKTVSGGAVSGQAVSGDAVKAEEETKKETKRGNENNHRFATDTNFYLPYGGDDWEEDRDGFVMYLKEDISQKEKVKVDKLDNLLCVTGEGIYYFKSDKTLWRMPVEKNKKGTDVPKPEEAEKILEEKDGIIADSGCYVNDSYIVYITYEGDAVKYDRQTGKKSSHRLEGNIASISYINEGCLIVANMYSGYFHWDLTEDTWTQFFKNVYAGEDPAAVNGNFYFYAVSPGYSVEEEIQLYYDAKEIRLYDAKEREDKVFVSESQLNTACKAYVKEQGGKYNCSDIWQIFSYKDKLYVEMQVDWIKNDTYQMKYVTLCADLAQGTELYVEQDWMDFKEKTSEDTTIHEKVDGCKTVVYNASSGIYMVDGKVIMLLGDAEDIACYDPVKKTGKIITEKDKKYYLPYYDTSYEEAYPEWLMEEGGMNLIPEELDGYWGC